MVLENTETQARVIKYVGDLKMVPKITTPIPSQPGLQTSLTGASHGNAMSAGEDNSDEFSQTDLELVLAAADGTMLVVKGSMDDGGCVYRCFSMAQQHAQGLDVTDDDEASWSLREKVISHFEGVVHQCAPQEQAEIQMQVELEMQDDPQWMDQMQGNMVWLGWSWDQYFAWMRQPWTFGTAHCLNACSRQTGTRVEVYQ